MIIESIEMENFKSHSNTRLEFNTGISIIIGENGAGKSSILEAVSFALFKQYSGRKIEELVKKGKEKMSVTLKFAVNGRKYRIKRQRNKSGSRAKLDVLEGEHYVPMVSQEKPVSEEVKKLLDMDGDLFLNAVYVRQGEIADLIEKTPSEKKQMIGKLLGIDSLEKAWKNMLPLINKYENKKENLQGRLDSMEGLDEDLTSKKDEKITIDGKIQDLDLKIEETSRKLGLMQEQKEDLDQKRENFNKLTAAIKSKNELLNKIKNDVENLEREIKDVEAKEARIVTMEPEVKRLENLQKLRNTLRKLKQAQENEKRANKVLVDIQRFKKVLDENYRSYKDYLVLNNVLVSLENERKEFEGSKALMGQLKTRRSQLEHQIREAEGRVKEQFEAANRILGRESTSIEELEECIQSLKPSMERKLEELTENMSKNQHEIRNLQDQNEKLKKLVKELKTVKNKCPVCKSDINESKRKELIEGYMGEVDSNKNQIELLNKTFKSFKSQKNVLNLKYCEVQTVNMDLLGEHFKTLEDSKADLKKVDDDLKEIEIKVSSFERIDSEIKTKKTIQEKLKKNYESYISAKGALESLGNLDEKKRDLNRVKLDLTSLNEVFDELVKGDPSLGEKRELTEEGLEKEILKVENIKNEYNRILGVVSRKESLIKRLELLRGDEAGTSSEVSKLTEDRENLGYREDLHENIQMRLYNSDQELTDLKGQKNHFNGRRTMFMSRIAELESELESFQGYKRELKQVKDFIKLLNYIRDLYGKDGVQKDLRNVSRPLIEQNTREFFERFNFEYSDIKLDEDYNITIYGPAGKNSLNMISGGEKIAVALALRFGITQTLSGGNLELIMLDEPTIHLDSYRRQELIELLKRMSIIPQMIIVTHETDLEEAADNILKVKKEDGNSFVLNS